MTNTMVLVATECRIFGRNAFFAVGSTSVCETILSSAGFLTAQFICLDVYPLRLSAYLTDFLVSAL